MTSRRSIKDVSHLFLSSAPAETRVSHYPVIGCYLTKSILHEASLLTQLVNATRTGNLETNVCFLASSNLVIRPTSEFEVTSLPDEVWTEGPSLRQPVALSSGTHAGCYFFVFREADCAKLNAFYTFFDPIVVAAEPHAKDLTEVYKLVKGIESAAPRKQWLIYYVAEGKDNGRNRLVTKEFNKITQRFLEVSVKDLFSNLSNQDTEWRQVLENIALEVTERQMNFVHWMESRKGVYESLP